MLTEPIQVPAKSEADASGSELGNLGLWRGCVVLGLLLCCWWPQDLQSTHTEGATLRHMRNCLWAIVV